MVQWLGICLPIQGTQFGSLVREDPTCQGATKACATACTLEPMGSNYRARTPRCRAPQREKPPQLKSGPHSLQLEKTCAQQRRPTTANKWINLKKKTSQGNSFLSKVCSLLSVPLLLLSHHFLVSPIPSTTYLPHLTTGLYLNKPSVNWECHKSKMQFYR